MKLRDYSVEIPEGKERSDGYIGMRHGQVYTIRIGNTGPKKCDAILSIDGLPMGTFRLNPKQIWSLEHPATSKGRFTFFGLNTAEAQSSLIQKDSQTGLIQVEFRPEYQEGFDSGLISFSDTEDPDWLGAGGTGLTGRSDQFYATAGKIRYAPEIEFIVISLRLGNLSRDSSEARPLPGRQISNPVPPPL